MTNFLFEMNIYINSEQKTVTDSATLQDVVLEFLHPNVSGMAIAVNNAIVTKPKWGETILCNDDKLLVIKACCGG
jgi:sulfur carrier protein